MPKLNKNDKYQRILVRLYGRGEKPQDANRRRIIVQKLQRQHDLESEAAVVRMLIDNYIPS